jgi:hypothetical protein
MQRTQDSYIFDYGWKKEDGEIPHNPFPGIISQKTSSSGSKKIEMIAGIIHMWMT